jgi:hypothetical protein
LSICRFADRFPSKRTKESSALLSRAHSPIVESIWNVWTIAKGKNRLERKIEIWNFGKKNATEKKKKKQIDPNFEIKTFFGNERVMCIVVYFDDGLF